MAPKSKRSRVVKRNKAGRRPSFETLEDRQLLAAYDLTTASTTVNINGAIFTNDEIVQGAGSGNIHSFVRIQAKGAEEGYNTSFRPLQFDEKSSKTFTHDLALSAVPVVLINGVTYREFLLDINQTNSTPLLSLNKVQVFTSAVGNQTGYSQPDAPTATPPTLGASTLIYDMDAGTDGLDTGAGTGNWVELDYSLQSGGSGKSDMFLYVPDSLFGAGANFVTLLSRFGENNPGNDGFEEWAVRAPNAINAISGTKYTDITGNSFSADDTALGGMTINLYQGNNASGALVASTTTAADGSYSFDNLAGGTYFVQETVPTGYTQTGGNAGYVVVVTSGVDSTDNNFDNFQKGRITGTKYTDITGNSFSADDTALGGVTINLYQGTDASGTLITSTTTAADGSYSFDNLGPGTYFVQETVPTGYTPTGGNSGYVVVVTSGVNSTGNNFDNFQKGRITGTKFTDITGNSFSADDTALGGVTINLYQGTNVSGALVGTTTTAADGSYSFDNLAGGTYFVQETVPTGYTQTGGNAGYVVVVTSGVDSTDNNFDNFQKGRITGTKYTDIRGNSFSADDTALGGVTISLYQGTDASGALVGTTTTAADGSYSFGNLAAGTYFVQETVPTGYTQTGGNSGYVVVVTSGVNSTANNFDNFQLGSICGQKFRDDNGDGIKNGADAGLLGWTIQLDKDANGTVDATTTTDANGNYRFTGLTAGTYRIREVNQPGWTQTTVNPADVTIVSGTISTGNNFGNEECEIIVIGPDKQNTATSLVKVVDKRTGQVESQFYAYEPNFKGGVRIATGDMDGDGVDEIITAPGRGRAPEIRVFKQDGTELTQFRTMAYATSFSGGVDLAVGDVNGDGKNDIVTVPTYGPTQVRVFLNNYNSANPAADPIHNSPDKQFAVFSNKFQGGADVTLADVGTFSNGATVSATTPDGKSEIVVGNGPGMRSTIFVYDVTGTPTVVDTILPFDNKFKGGITLDAARINADLIPDFIVSSGVGGKSAIEIWSGLTNDGPDVRLSAFNAFTGAKTVNAAVHAVAMDTNDDGIADTIVAVQGTDGATGEIRSFSPSGVLQSNLTGFNGSWNIARLRCHEPLAVAFDQVFDQLGV